MLGASFLLWHLRPQPDSWASMRRDLYTQSISYGLAMAGIFVICAALAGLVGQAVARAWEKHKLKRQRLRSFTTQGKPA